MDRWSLDNDAGPASSDCEPGDAYAGRVRLPHFDDGFELHSHSGIGERNRFSERDKRGDVWRHNRFDGGFHI